MIERAAIIARDGRLSLRDVLPLRHFPHVVERKSSEAVPLVRTKNELRQMERATVLRALEESEWRVSGAKGAASKLGVPASTLSSRMKSLRIHRPK